MAPSWSGTPCSPPTPSLSTPMSLLCSTTRPSSISLSSRPTWCHTPVSTSCCPHTPQSSPPRRPTTSSSPSLRSPTPPPATVSTWLAALCTEVTSSPRTSTLPLPPSRPREPSSSSTGAQLASSAVSTTSPQLPFPVVISPRLCAPSA